MSEDRPPPPPPPPPPAPPGAPRPPRKRPANVNRRADVRARPAKGRRFTEQDSRLAGYLVLGLGVLAVIAVAILAFQERGAGSREQVDNRPPASDPIYNFGTRQQNAPPPAPTTLNNRAARDLGNALDTSRPAPAPTSAPRRDLNFQRQPGIAARDLEGRWQAVIGKYTAVLRLSGGAYEVVLADPNEYGRRLYSAGTYRKIEDILVLTPQRSWPPPAAPQGYQVDYVSMTAAPFPMIAATMQGKMLWQNPPRSERRVLVPNASPLFMGQPQDYIVWERLAE